MPSIIQNKSIRALSILLVLVVGLGFSTGANTSVAASTKTLGNLSGKWSLPSTVKLPKSKCGTIPVTFKLGPKSLSEGTGSTYVGVSSLMLYTPEKDLIAIETVTWDDYTLEQNGSSSIKFKMRYCKEDWQNADGDFLAGLKKGTISVGAYIESINNVYDEFRTTIKVTS